MNLIFDIGYNKGLFTKVCFEKYPNCKVIAVEANPDLCNKQNSSNFVLLSCAASDSCEGKVELYIDNNSDGISTVSSNFRCNSRFAKGSKNLDVNWANWNKVVQVPKTTLDNIILQYGVPDFIKIDVEGYELNVINGLSQKAGVISLEWHEEDYSNLEKIVDHLLSLGYKEFGVIGWFDEGDIYERFTFSEKGDPFLQFPNKFYTWDDLKMKDLIKEERRINYGMFFAK